MCRDESKSEEVLLLKARQVIEWDATYDVFDPVANEGVGSLRRKAMKSMIRDERLLFDPDGAEIGRVYEDSRMLALPRRLHPWIAAILPQTYHGDVHGRPACIMKQNYNPFIHKLEVDDALDPERILDRRLGIAAALVMSAIEGRQGSFSTTMRVMPMSPQQLASMIADVAVLRGDFTLRSGRKSSYYIDKYLFSTRPDILRELGAMFAQRIGENVMRLAGAELGGIPLVTAVSLATDLPCVYIRSQKKEYGTAKQIEGELNAGDRVVIIEDVATTGGQVLEAAGILQELGADVTQIIAVIDRQEGARENIEDAGFYFDALFTTEDLGVG